MTPEFLQDRDPPLAAPRWSGLVALTALRSVRWRVLMEYLVRVIADKVTVIHLSPAGGSS